MYHITYLISTRFESTCMKIKIKMSLNICISNRTGYKSHIYDVSGFQH